MGIPILVRLHLYIETAPRELTHRLTFCWPHFEIHHLERKDFPFWCKFHWSLLVSNVMWWRNVKSHEINSIVVPENYSMTNSNAYFVSRTHFQAWSSSPLLTHCQLSVELWFYGVGIVIYFEMECCFLTFPFSIRKRSVRFHFLFLQDVW